MQPAVLGFGLEAEPVLSILCPRNRNNTVVDKRQRKGERLAAIDRERYSVHRIDASDLARQQAAQHRKMLLQVGDAQQRFAHATSPR